MGLIQSSHSDETTLTTITYKFPFYKSEKTITYLNGKKVYPENSNEKIDYSNIENDKLIDILKSMSFDSHRKMMLNDYLKYNKIESKYINDIAQTFTFDSDKLKVYKLMIDNMK